MLLMEVGGYLLKKVLLTALMLLLLPVCFAEVEYALQDGVRVYAENGLAGLEDAAGNALCEAKYTCIEAFLDRDYAVFHEGELCGIISREGKEVVPAKWQLIEFTSDGLTAVGYGYADNRIGRHVYDLKTGEVLYEEKKNESVSVEGNRINVYSHHKKWFYRPPFRTDIYDSRMNLIFSKDARLQARGEVYIAEFNDGSYGILDMDGQILLNGIAGCWFNEDDTISYHRERYRHANAFEACIDIIGNALDRGLWKNSGDYRDRNCVEWVLYRLGYVTQPRKVIPTVGIFDGNETVFEYSGKVVQQGSLQDLSESVKNGGEGLYLVHVGGEKSADRWIYVDESGNQAVPGNFDRAYVFIDGTAVVYTYDEGYFLIGKDGERIGDVVWGQSWIDDGSFEHAVIPVYTVEPIMDGIEERYYRLMNRKGEFISDTRYKTVEWAYWGCFNAVDMQGNLHMLDENGNSINGKVWERDGGDPHEDVSAPWVKHKGLYYHIDMATGEFTHEQGYSEVGFESACLPDGKNWVVIDEKGNPVGPYYGYEATQSGGGWNAFG